MGIAIIVPGIGGCELHTPPALLLGGRSIRLWLDYANLIAGGWRLLGLSADGITPDVPFTGQLSAGSPLREYYGILGDYIQSQGHHVVGATLDWRESLVYDGARLRSLIASQPTGYDIYLIAHSRGGLVVREALSQMTGPGERSRIALVISLGTPHYGSWAAAGMLAGWEPTIATLTLLLANIASTSVILSAVTSVLSVVCSWPAVYELLPSPSAPGVNASEIAAVYSSAAWASAQPTVRPHWLDYARDRWLHLPMPPAGITWLSIVGTGLSTPTRLRVGGSLADQAGWDRTYAGDGTVPAAWASVPGQPICYAPVGHAALTYDPRVLMAIGRALAGNIPATQSLGGAPEGLAILG